MQVVVNNAMDKAGFKEKTFTTHTLRHRFATHILPKNFVKIGHTGYLYAKNKMERIAAVCKQLQFPAPMIRVHTPVALRLLLQTGKDITLCPVCKKGKMELVTTYIYHHSCLVDAAQLRNRRSPKIKSKKCYP